MENEYIGEKKNFYYITYFREKSIPRQQEVGDSWGLAEAQK